jgi:LysM repeat protein
MRAAPISTMRSLSGSKPVVSRSRATSSRSSLVLAPHRGEGLLFDHRMPAWHLFRTFSPENRGSNKAAADAATATKTHTVEKGENLSVIAEQELGTQSRWKELYELNKDLIGKNPDLIQPGMELKLPQ